MLCCGLRSSNWVTRMATFPSQNPSSKPLPHTANGGSQRQLKELIKQWSEGFICLVQFVCWILESDAVLPLPNFNLFLTSVLSKNGNLLLQQNPNALSPNQAQNKKRKWQKNPEGMKMGSQIASRGMRIQRKVPRRAHKTTSTFAAEAAPMPLHCCWNNEHSQADTKGTCCYEIKK